MRTAAPIRDTDRADGAAAALRTHRRRSASAPASCCGGPATATRAWFSVDDDALPAAAAEVADVTRTRYPDLNIPFHSRWRHFEAGGVDRRADAWRARRCDVPAR